MHDSWITTIRKLLYMTQSELSTVQNMRVVQRNLVYVVGLALDLCHEDTLKGGDYFGQFGRIVKVCRWGAAPSLTGQPHLHRRSPQHMLYVCRSLSAGQGLMAQPRLPRMVRVGART